MPQTPSNFCNVLTLCYYSIINIINHIIRLGSRIIFQILQKFLLVTLVSLHAGKGAFYKILIAFRKNCTYTSFQSG